MRRLYNEDKTHGIEVKRISNDWGNKFAVWPIVRGDSGEWVKKAVLGTFHTQYEAMEWGIETMARRGVVINEPNSMRRPPQYPGYKPLRGPGSYWSPFNTLEEKR